MKVKDLIAMLETCQPETEVKILTTKKLEHVEIAGVISRSKWGDPDIYVLTDKPTHPALEEVEYKDIITSLDIATKLFSNMGISEEMVGLMAMWKGVAKDLQEIKKFLEVNINPSPK